MNDIDIMKCIDDFTQVVIDMILHSENDNATKIQKLDILKEQLIDNDGQLHDFFKIQSDLSNIIEHYKNKIGYDFTKLVSKTVDDTLDLKNICSKYLAIIDKHIKELEHNKRPHLI